MNTTIDLPVILLLFSPLAAAIISICGKFIPSRYTEWPGFIVWIAGSITALAAAFPVIASGATLQYSLGGWAEPLGISLEITGLTWIATLTDIIIASSAWLCTRRSGQSTPLFYFFFFMALFSLQGVLCTRDIFNLFVWFEVLSLSSFVLISYDRSLISRIAAFRYLLISSMSILLFLIGVWILYQLFGELGLVQIGIKARALRTGGSPPSYSRAAGAAAGLITAGILTRAAIIPFHTWLPDAHSAAPYQVSALLSGFVIKAPMLALWRIFDAFSFPELLDLLIWIGGICALWGVLAAMVQRDAKKLLGYHSVSQMGYIIAAFGAGSRLGRTAALFYIIAHALFKSLLFLSVGRVTVGVGSRDVYAIRGGARRFPADTFFFIIAAASISGIPFFAGFTGKILVTESLYGHPVSYMLLAAGVGTAASFFKLARIFTGKPSPEEPSPGEHGSVQEEDTKVSVSAFIGMSIVAAGCIILGAFPGIVDRGIESLATGSTRMLKASFIDWYSLSHLKKASFSIGSGFLLSFLLVSGPGRSLSHIVRGLKTGLNGSLRLILLGFLVLIIFTALSY